MDQDDIDDFKAAMANTKPIKTHDKVVPSRPKTRIKRRPVQADAIDYSEHTLSMDEIDQPVGIDEHLFYAKQGINAKTLRRLRQGKLSPLKVLDLHELTQEQALAETDDFIAINKARGNKYLLLIHGKGYYSRNNVPVLKNLLNQWLRNHPDVVAFSKAQARDGGTGALYLIIKS